MGKSKSKSSRRSEAIRTIPQRSYRISHIPSLVASPVRLSLSRSFKRSNARSHALAKRLIRSVPITPVKAHAIQQSFINYANNSHLIKNTICAKRKIRREVLFAIGKGGGNHRPPSYSLESQIRCS